MDFYFADRQFQLKEIVSSDNSTEVVIADEEDKLSVENGNRTLTGTLYFSPSQTKSIKEFAKIGNYILFHDMNSKDIWMTIVETIHNPKECSHFFVAEDAGIDLLNELVGPYKADKAYSIAYYIEKFMYDSGFEIGFNEIPALTRKLEWESEDSTALARLISVANQFDNAEIDFSFKVDGTKVIRKYINIYKKRGKDNRQTLYVNVDVDNIIVKSDIYDLGTSIYATGGTPEGKNEPINLKGYKYTDQEGRFVLGSDGVMRDTESVQLWSRLLSTSNPNPKSSHIQRLKRYETTDKKTLCDSVIRELKKISQPAINYEVELINLPDGVNIGDTIYLVDENEEVYLSARILELIHQYSTFSYSATLGDYLIQSGGTSQGLIDLAYELKDQANRKRFEVKLEPTSQAFVDGRGTIKISAKVYDGNLDVSTNYNDFRWTRLNESGEIDDNWSASNSILTVYPDEKNLWTYCCDVYNSEKNQIGSGRTTILNLKNGGQGVGAYLYYAWADDQTGSTGFVLSKPTNAIKHFMGICSTSSVMQPTNPSQYTWQINSDWLAERLEKLEASTGA